MFLLDKEYVENLHLADTGVFEKPLGRPRQVMTSYDHTRHRWKRLEEDVRFKMSWIRQ